MPTDLAPIRAELVKAHDERMARQYLPGTVPGEVVAELERIIHLIGWIDCHPNAPRVEYRQVLEHVRKHGVPAPKVEIRKEHEDPDPAITEVSNDVCDDRTS